MIVQIVADEARLDQADDFRRFSVACPGPRQEATPGVVDGVSFENQDVAWVSINTLIGLQGAAATPEWRDSLARMIAKAQPHGWISADGLSIRAHVTWDVSPE